jgi:hypothetical protein
MTATNPKRRSLLTDYTDPEAHAILFRGYDLQARFLLLDLAEREYNVENYEGTAKLIHAMLYLEDRLAYELFPPPGKYAIPLRG